MQKHETIGVVSIIAAICAALALLLVIGSQNTILTVVVYLMDGDTGTLVMLLLLIVAAMNIITAVVAFTIKGTDVPAVQKEAPVPDVSVPKLDTCPDCGYKLLSFGNYQKCTSCGFTTKP